ncbi:hypothetical protein BC834DRAFT_862026 [Gloeopeniophorella convolvens]|nr:hypothetical protein BC834DRAFT_862026 [Gloeopeniophorella convolvens]
MSGFEATATNPTVLGDGRPSHHIHNPNEPLPGAPGGQIAPDYSTGALSGTKKPGDFDREPYEEQRFEEDHDAADPRGQNAFTSERPSDVKPTQSGGVARGGQDNLPVGKANFLDKVIGKTEKVIGKVTKNADMHETGELRETGGKKAAIGEARAAHD